MEKSKLEKSVDAFKASLNKYSIAIIIIILLLLAYITFLYNTTPTVQFGNGQAYPITNYATSIPQLERGLMYTNVTNNTILLMQYNTTAKDWITMNNTYDPLDIIWVQASIGVTGITGKVVELKQNVPACSNGQNCTLIDPSTVSNYVIEAHAGFIQQNNISVGEQVSITSIR
ncbi:MAG: DUF192 domain-containing protein [Gammaproteobacteria bacterium]